MYILCNVPNKGPPLSYNDKNSCMYMYMYTYINKRVSCGYCRWGHCTCVHACINILYLACE